MTFRRSVDLRALDEVAVLPAVEEADANRNRSDTRAVREPAEGSVRQDVRGEVTNQTAAQPTKQKASVKAYPLLPEPDK